MNGSYSCFSIFQLNFRARMWTDHKSCIFICPMPQLGGSHSAITGHIRTLDPTLSELQKSSEMELSLLANWTRNNKWQRL